MKYKNYYNFELGSRDIYSKNHIRNMTVGDLFKYELPLSYQYNTIGIPDDEELEKSMFATQYTDENGNIRWKAESPDSWDGSKNMEELQNLEQNLPVQNDASIPINDYNGDYSPIEEYKSEDGSRLFNLGVQESKNLNDVEQNSPEFSKDEVLECINSTPSNDKGALPPVQQNNPVGDSVVYEGSVMKSSDPYYEVQNDPNLSQDEKVEAIRKITEARNQEIDKEHKAKMTKIATGGALEIGSNFIPWLGGAKAIGGVAKALGPVAKKYLAPKIGKKLTEAAVKSTAEGVVSAPVNAVGKSFVEDKDLSKSFIPDTVQGLGQNVLFGMAHPVVGKALRGKQLKSIKNYGELSQLRKGLSQGKYMKYYDDYIEGTTTQKKPKSRPSFQLTEKEWDEWLKKARLKK